MEQVFLGVPAGSSHIGVVQYGVVNEMNKDVAQPVEQDPLAALDQIEDDENSYLDKDEVAILARLLSARVNL